MTHQRGGVELLVLNQLQEPLEEVPSVVHQHHHLHCPRGGSQSKARDVERSRLASICAFRSATFCSAVAMGSAPAITRHGGGSWLAMMMSARASMAGSPDCWPFWAFQNS